MGESVVKVPHLRRIVLQHPAVVLHRGGRRAAQVRHLREAVQRSGKTSLRISLNKT